MVFVDFENVDEPPFPLKLRMISNYFSNPNYARTVLLWAITATSLMWMSNLHFSHLVEHYENAFVFL